MESRHDSWAPVNNYEEEESDVENSQSDKESENSNATYESCLNSEHCEDSDSIASDSEASDNYTYDEVRAILRYVLQSRE